MKNDCVSVLRTGYGKSLIFEILLFMELSVNERRCIVILICPLNNIIDQEMEKLGPIAFRASSLQSHEDVNLDDIHFLTGHQEDILTPHTMEKISPLCRKILHCRR
jgi:replicative superfamily II helicase